MLIKYYFRQDSHGGLVRVYPGRLQTDIPFCVVSVDRQTTAKDLIVESLARFGFTSHNSTDYRLSQVLLEHGGKFVFFIKIILFLNIISIYLLTTL